MLQVEQDQHYQNEREELEILSKQLKKTKEHLSMMSLHAHMLQVDLASQFNPFMIEKIKNAKDLCGKCGETMKAEKKLKKKKGLQTVVDPGCSSSCSSTSK